MAIPRTHVIAVYEPPKTAADPYAPGGSQPTLVASGIPANLQPLIGRVRQTAAGRAIDASWKGFVPPEYGHLIVEDRLVFVQEGLGPQVFRVRQVGPHGPRWDTEFLLDTTSEEIPEEVRP